MNTDDLIGLGVGLAAVGIGVSLFSSVAKTVKKITPSKFKWF